MSHRTVLVLLSSAGVTAFLKPKSVSGNNSPKVFIAFMWIHSDQDILLGIFLCDNNKKNPPSSVFFSLTAQRKTSWKKFTQFQQVLIWGALLSKTSYTKLHKGFISLKTIQAIERKQASLTKWDKKHMDLLSNSHFFGPFFSLQYTQLASFASLSLFFTLFSLWKVSLYSLWSSCAGKQRRLFYRGPGFRRGFTPATQNGLPEKSSSGWNQDKTCKNEISPTAVLCQTQIHMWSIKMFFLWDEPEMNCWM